MTKYHSIRTVVDGISFASKAEARRYSELKLLERSGKIQSLELQPRFHLQVNGEKICTYVGDFSYLEDGKAVIEDVKGMKTREYKLKKKLLRALHGIEIREVR